MPAPGSAPGRGGLPVLAWTVPARLETGPVSRASPFRAVIFDWRGTLVTTLDEHRWVAVFLGLAGRGADEASVQDVLVALRPVQPRLEAVPVQDAASTQAQAPLVRLTQRLAPATSGRSARKSPERRARHPFGVDRSAPPSRRARRDRTRAMTGITTDARTATAAIA